MMKSMTITFATFWGALRHQWKCVVVVTLCFALLGCGIGYIYAGSDAVPAAGKADALKPVDFSLVNNDASYYRGCSGLLATGLNNARQYLNTLLGEKTVTPLQKETLNLYLKELTEWETMLYEPVETALAVRDRIYIPVEHLTAQTEYYENLLENARRDLVVAEQAVELVKNMQAPTVQTESITKSYETLLASAAAYGVQIRNVQLYEDILENLADEDTVQTNSKWMASALKKAAGELNGLMADISAIADEIAKENWLEYLAVYDVNEAVTLTINHTHGDVDKTENFVVVVLFATLVGLCAGAFFAVCREAKKEKSNRVDSSVTTEQG